MTKIAPALFLTLFAQGAHAQTFEVASVKASDPNAPGTMISYLNGTFQATGITKVANQPMLSPSGNQEFAGLRAGGGQERIQAEGGRGKPSPWKYKCGP